jgi:regulator of cell morphogenesis and NO signaling
MHEYLTDTTIGEIVAADHRAAAVFARHGIDFCCGGRQGFRQACESKGLDAQAVADELGNLGATPAQPAPRFNTWDLDFLADYVVANHHAYLRAVLPVLRGYTRKIADVHGERHPELIEIAGAFRAVADELEGHMMKEEQILFPYIRDLARAERTGRALPSSPFGTIANPIAVMEQEHEGAGDGLERIRALSGGYEAPADGCTTYRVCFAELRDFEADLHQHIHLENNILFPKAIALETRMTDRRVPA